MTRDTTSSRDAIALFSEEDVRRLNARWEAIQSSFVESPRESMRSADELVEDVMSIISDTFQRERRQLESQWDNDTDVSTEVLRQTLQRYHVFFDRLLGTTV